MKKRIGFGVLILSFISSYCLAFNNQDISESEKSHFVKSLLMPRPSSGKTLLNTKRHILR